MVNLNRRQEKRAKEIHRSRSEKSKRIDDRKRAEIANSFSQWKENPDRFDLPNVDTPNADFRGFGVSRQKVTDVVEGLDDNPGQTRSELQDSFGLVDEEFEELEKTGEIFPGDNDEFFTF